MDTTHDVMNVTDLELLIEQLSQEIERKRGQGPLSIRHVQQSAASLTRLQLLLNEIERFEAQERGASREMAGLFYELASRMRAMQVALGMASAGGPCVHDRSYERPSGS
jgi:uncharacterized small protein (DUF1192 family)